mmetsp:Transcript_30603/g.39240  ORF Transcript_30603/g.39240 Transcript_30603/m.39240 type:complete len:548 (+) Transcript_30603:244-1887(+)
MPLTSEELEVLSSFRNSLTELLSNVNKDRNRPQGLMAPIPAPISLNPSAKVKHSNPQTLKPANALSSEITFRNPNVTHPPVKKCSSWDCNDKPGFEQLKIGMLSLSLKTPGSSPRTSIAEKAKERAKEMKASLTATFGHLWKQLGELKELLEKQDEDMGIYQKRSQKAKRTALKQHGRKQQMGTEDLAPNSSSSEERRKALLQKQMKVLLGRQIELRLNLDYISSVLAELEDTSAKEEGQNGRQGSLVDIRLFHIQTELKEYEEIVEKKDELIKKMRVELHKIQRGSFRSDSCPDLISGEGKERQESSCSNTSEDTFSVHDESAFMESHYHSNNPSRMNSPHHSNNHSRRNSMISVSVDKAPMNDPLQKAVLALILMANTSSTFTTSLDKVIVGIYALYHSFEANILAQEILQEKLQEVYQDTLPLLQSMKKYFEELQQCGRKVEELNAASSSSLDESFSSPLQRRSTKNSRHIVVSPISHSRQLTSEKQGGADDLAGPCKRRQSTPFPQAIRGSTRTSFQNVRASRRASLARADSSESLPPISPSF